MARVEVPDTDISFELRSFTGREYVEYSKTDHLTTPISEVVSQTLAMVCETVYKDGEVVEDYLDLKQQEEIIPLYFAAVGEVRPKVPSGIRTDES